MRPFVLQSSALAALVFFPAAASAQVFFGPTPYLSQADSPFTGSFSYSYLEDFEDGALNTPGLSSSTGLVTSPGALVDSVDADDGAIDGFGTAGHSFYAQLSFIDFSFDAAVLGSLPTHAGLVWTDVGVAPVFGTAPVTFEAFDALGVSLGDIAPVLLGDGAVDGGTAEDRFFGVRYDGGISRIRIGVLDSNDWEVDHVQYALIPSPGTALLIGLGALSALRRDVR